MGVAARVTSTRGGSITRCPGLKIPIKATIAFDAKRLAVSFRCNLYCVYRTRLVRISTGATTAAKSGRAEGETRTTVALARKVRSGRYRLLVSLTHGVNPAAPVVRQSATFTVR